jgi:hypothetical protein
METIKKLTDQNILAEIAKNDADLQVCKAAIENLTDLTILAELTQSAKHSSLTEILN